MNSQQTEQVKPKVKKKTGYKIFFFFFVVAVIAVIAYGIRYVFLNTTSDSYTFTSDGYAIVYDSNNTKTEKYAFNAGTLYEYKKYDDKVTFTSLTSDAKISTDTIIHYQDGGLLTLKKIVGLDLTTIDQSVIFYYNIFKNTNIQKDSDAYFINLQLRKKYLLINYF